ncbi:MAG: D-aminoacyl-tRNA deacylase [Gudongella sp.]|jgi:D-tyrosyl-tRNA(Tyr) deacylase|nr:D-aminoacyl-tRNA deacylase [Gudongella sp.]
MRAVIQRVTEASVTVSDKIIGEIGIGLLVYLGVGKEDKDEDLNYICEKVSGLRIFEDENEKMNLSVMDVNGDILAISQFTLYGDARKGKRPSFTDSADPQVGEHYYDLFVDKLRERGIKVETGEFGAHMDVKYTNDGPVTIILDSKKIL